MRLVLLAALVAAPISAQQTKQTDGQIVGDIAATPLSDTNIRTKKIPPILDTAAANPYAAPVAMSCAGITTQIASLTDVLGPDFDAAAEPSNGKEGRVAAGVARGVVQGLIPFRGVIREVSGAAGAQRRYDAAVDAGIARRGYLRGLARAQGCR